MPRYTTATSHETDKITRQQLLDRKESLLLLFSSLSKPPVKSSEFLSTETALTRHSLACHKVGHSHRYVPGAEEG